MTCHLQALLHGPIGYFSGIFRVFIGYIKQRGQGVQVSYPEYTRLRGYIIPTVYPIYTLFIPTVYPIYTRCKGYLYPMHRVYIPDVYPLYTRCIPFLYPMYTVFIPFLYPIISGFIRKKYPIYTLTWVYTRRVYTLWVYTLRPKGIYTRFQVYYALAARNEELQNEAFV